MIKLAVTFFCLLFSLIFFLSPNANAVDSTPAARLISSRGQVDISTLLNRAWQKASPGMILYHGTTIRTGGNGTASLLIADETLVKLNRNTKFTIKEASVKAGWHQLRGIIPASSRGSKTRVALDGGEAWFLNKNQDTNFEVETSTVTAAIRGTEFNVLMSPEATVHVAVMEGHVMVGNDFGNLILAAGEEAVTTPGSAPVKRMLLRPADAVQWTIILPSLVTPRDLKLINQKRAVLLQEKETFIKKVTDASEVQDIIHLGLIHRDLDEPKRARKILEAARQQNPDNSQVITGLAWLLLDENKFTEAIELFSQAKEKNALNLAGFAAALLHLNRLQEAKKLLDKARIDFPDTPLLEFDTISLQIRRGEIRAANDALTDLVQHYENFGGAWEMLTLTSLVLDEKENARIAIEKAKNLLPDSPTPLIISAYINQANFNLSKGALELKQALKLENNNITAAIALARIEFGSGNVAGAKDLLKKSDKFSPNNPEILNLLGFIKIAQRDKSAKDTFAKTIALAPEMAEPRLGEALCQMRAGNEAEALEQISTAVLLEPRRAIFRSYWAKMLYQLGRHKKALDVLDIAKNIDPNDPTPELYRALALKDLKRPSEAIAALQNAIALNDNKAVYRSRFLLDQDLAVKNINLATLFYNLNITDWATTIAADSLKDDYSNSAGHLFYSGSLLLDPERSLARDTENLLARILRPANRNTFNSFNEYTTFFDEPGGDASFTLEAGNKSTLAEEINLSGALPGWNIAGQLLASHYKTDGWRETNYREITDIIGFLKWDLAPGNSLLLSADTRWSEFGDKASPLYEYDNPADPRDSRQLQQYFFETGYHFTPHQGLNFLMHYSRKKIDQDLINYSLLQTTRLEGELMSQIQFAEPYDQFQGEIISRYTKHQFIAGVINYIGKQQFTSDTQGLLEISPPSGIFFPFTLLADNSVPQHAITLFGHDIYQITPHISAETALYFDKMATGDSQTGVTWNIEDISPRLGISWIPETNYNIRLASFKYLQPFNASRLEPVDIAGIPVYRNGSPGTIVKETDMTFDHQWPTGFVSINLFYNDSDYRKKNSTGTMIEDNTYSKGGYLRFNYLPADGVGLACRYQLKEISSNSASQLERNDHLASLNLTRIWTNGVEAEIKQIFRRLDFNDTNRNNEDIFLTDLSISYEFPRKKGKIAINVANLFDSHFNWFTDVSVGQGQEPARRFSVSLDLFY